MVIPTFLRPDKEIKMCSSIEEIKQIINQAIVDFQFPELHPDLRSYVDEDELHHPLLQLNGGVFPGRYNRINKMYAFKRGLLIRGDSGNEWQKFYPNLSAYDRIQKFDEIELKRDDFPRQTPEYFRLLGEIWTDLELMGQPSNFLEFFMGYAFNKTPSENVRYFMTPSEQTFFAGFPDDLIVYRGHYEKLKHGMSWTLQPSIALQYALGTPLGNEISVGTVSKTSAIAYINRWDEDEVIVPPNSVDIMGTIKLREGKVF